MQDLKERTKAFALEVIRFTRTLPRGDEFQIIKRQLIRSATPVAANYRASQRAKSRADFIHKLGTVEEEPTSLCSGRSFSRNWPRGNTRTSHVSWPRPTSSSPC